MGILTELRGLAALVTRVENLEQTNSETKVTTTDLDKKIKELGERVARLEGAQDGVVLKSKEAAQQATRQAIEDHLNGSGKQLGHD